VTEAAAVQTGSMKKPPYQVPPTASIMRTRDCGLRTASTFTGAGGSCLGFRMAGFRTLWSSEFHDRARESYLANFGDTLCDPRDVRLVTADEVLAATGLKPGELDVLEGSPPCQSFSTAGKGAKGWGQVKAHSDGTSQRSDDLFFEFIRLLRGLKPRAFVAENVAGLTRGQAKGVFIRVMDDLRASGYRVGARLLNAKWMGVPQARIRVFIIGIREDLGIEPAYPTPLPYFYSIADALPWLATADARQEVLVIDPKGQFEIDRRTGDQAAPTITATMKHHMQTTGPQHPGDAPMMHTRGQKGVRGNIDARRWPAPTIANAPGDYAVSSPEGATITRRAFQTGQRRDSGRPGPTLTTDSADNLVTGGGLPPDVADVPGVSPYLVAAARSVAPGDNHEKYFNLADPDPDRPSPTIAAMWGQGCPAQVLAPGAQRRFSILEVKRLCSFPDDYVLTGSYADQWARLGNSVPPLMAYRVAMTLRDQLLAAKRGR